MICRCRIYTKVTRKIAHRGGRFAPSCFLWKTRITQTQRPIYMDTSRRDVFEAAQRSQHHPYDTQLADTTFGEMFDLTADVVCCVMCFLLLLSSFESHHLRLCVPLLGWRKSVRKFVPGNPFRPALRTETFVYSFIQVHLQVMCPRNGSAVRTAQAPGTRPLAQYWSKTILVETWDDVADTLRLVPNIILRDRQHFVGFATFFTPALCKGGGRGHSDYL